MPSKAGDFLVATNKFSRGSGFVYFSLLEFL